MTGSRPLTLCRLWVGPRCEDQGRFPRRGSRDRRDMFDANLDGTDALRFDLARDACRERTFVEIVTSADKEHAEARTVVNHPPCPCGDAFEGTNRLVMLVHDLGDHQVLIQDVVKAARDHGVLLEVNAQSDRLDLNDLHIVMARQMGVRVVISTDAHRVEELNCMRYGVDQARRGWCERHDVANTLRLDAFRNLIRK